MRVVKGDPERGCPENDFEDDARSDRGRAELRGRTNMAGDDKCRVVAAITANRGGMVALLPKDKTGG